MQLQKLVSFSCDLSKLNNVCEIKELIYIVKVYGFKSLTV